MKIARNDIVEVIAGAEKGKQGRVLRVLLGEDRVVVEKVRLTKQHKKQIKGQAAHVSCLFALHGTIPLSKARWAIR